MSKSSKKDVSGMPGNRGTSGEVREATVCPRPNDGISALLHAGFDVTDAVIVSTLRHDGHTTLAELAKLTSLSASSVQSRIQKLERRGVLTGCRYQVNYDAVGLGVSAFISVLPLDYEKEEITPDLLKQLEGVVSCYSVSGEPSYVLLVRVPSTQALDDLLTTIHKTVSAATRSMVILKPYFRDLF